MSTKRKDARDVIIEYFSGDGDEQRPLVIAGMMDIAKSCFEQYMKRVEKEGSGEQPRPEKPKVQRAVPKPVGICASNKPNHRGQHQQMRTCKDFVVGQASVEAQARQGTKELHQVAEQQDNPVIKSGLHTVATSLDNVMDKAGAAD